MTETITKKKRAVKPKEKLAEYKLTIKLNDKVFTIESDDIRSAILSVKPEFLRTRVIIGVEKSGVEKKIERMFYLQQGKMLFMNKYAMDTFIKNLIF